MAQIIQASNLELYEVEERFNLREIRSLDFFQEWQIETPEVSDYEKHYLDSVQEDFLGVSKHPLNEEIVKLMVLAPLLSLAGLLRPPFIPEAEKPVEIVLEDEDEIIRGRIDVLVIYRGLWAVVVEAKRHSLNVSEGLAQALFHMMANPDNNKPAFALLLNGTEFQFVKLVKQETPEYGLSRLFSLRNPGNELYTVLGILKHLREIVLQ